MGDPGRKATGGGKSKSSLADLGARLHKARDAGAAARRSGPSLAIERKGSYGVAWRLSVELAVAIAVCVGVGWALDDWLGTRPWFMLVFFVLGAVVGMLNVYRAARQINAAAAEQSGEPEDDVS